MSVLNVYRKPASLSLFDDLLTDFYTPLRRLGPESLAPADVLENDNSYIVSLDVPGLNTDDFTIDYQDNILTVSGKREDKKDSEKDGVHLSERRFGSFKRSIVIKNIDQNKIEAAYEQGVLRVVLPKSEKSKPVRVKIQEAP